AAHGFNDHVGVARQQIVELCRPDRVQAEPLRPEGLFQRRAAVADVREGEAVTVVTGQQPVVKVRRRTEAGEAPRCFTPRCTVRGWRRDNLDNLDNLYNLYRVYRVYRVSGWYRKREMNRGSQSVLISPLCGAGIGTSTATVVGRVVAVASQGLSLSHSG